MTTSLGIAGGFVEERAPMTWRELLYALDHGIVGAATIVELCAARVARGDVDGDVIEVAGLGKDERWRVRDVVQRRAVAEALAPERDALEKWLYVALAWVFENPALFAEGWPEVERIYADFGYPVAMKPFVPYEPAPAGVTLGSREENAARMRAAWRAFLDACAVRYSAAPGGE